jgi:ElaB/YqjD/DUF883 family membrane-anchored ribosome-binding protein
MEPKPGSNPQGSTSNPQRSGSDTVSAANISAGTSPGTGQPPNPQTRSAQSSTLASHTSKPMGGSVTGSGQSSQGPEHLRHQDKDTGKGLGESRSSSSQGGGQSQSAADLARGTAEQVQQRAGELYGQASEKAGQAYEQASEKAGQAYEQASDWARGAYEEGSRRLESARRSMPDVGQYGGAVQRFVSENPVLVGVVGLAAGLLLGALLPRTRHEDRTFGRWSDDLRDQGMRYARDMTQRGREYVDEAFGEGDERFASHESEWRGDDQRRGPSGRFQNH